MSRGSAFVALVAGALLLASSAFAPAAAQSEFHGKTDVYRGEPTSEGTWSGSWMYVSRDQRWALWLRERPKGKVEAKLQYQAQGAPETFETDWTGTAEYYLGGTPVKFELKLTRTTPEKLEGSWNWVASFPDSERIETAQVSLYRVAYGRSLVLDFGKEFTRIVRRGARETKTTPLAAWGFTKVSKRHVSWDEMPW